MAFDGLQFANCVPIFVKILREQTMTSSLSITYATEARRDDLRKTRALRAARLDTDKVFDAWGEIGLRSARLRKSRNRG